VSHDPVAMADVIAHTMNSFFGFIWTLWNTWLLNGV